MYAILKKPIIFTFESLERIQDNNKSRRELFKELDKKIGDLASKDPKLYKKLIFITATTLIDSSMIVKATTIDEAGSKLYGMAQSVGYWVILVMLCVDLLKNSRNGKDAITNVIVRYILIASALFGGKWVIDIIKGMF